MFLEIKPARHWLTAFSKISSQWVKFCVGLNIWNVQVFLNLILAITPAVNHLNWLTLDQSCVFRHTYVYQVSRLLMQEANIFVINLAFALIVWWSTYWPAPIFYQLTWVAQDWSQPMEECVNILVMISLTGWDCIENEHEMRTGSDTIWGWFENWGKYIQDSI